MKLLFSVVFVLALASTAFSSSAYWGFRNANDILLSRTNVFNRAVRNSYATANVNFPGAGQTNNRNITAVYVYDRFTNSSGAIPALWSGGPGFRFATVNLKSQYNYGINSTVEIYGRR